MGVMPDREVEELRSYLRTFLDKEASETRLRRLIEEAIGYDTELWAHAAGLGLQAMAVPERFGGGGLSLPALGMVFEELGRTLACAPFLPTLGLAVPALVCAAPDVAQGWLREIAEGSASATLVWGGPRPSETALRVTGGALSGEVALALDAAEVDYVLVAAREPDGAVGLFVVRRDAPGYAVTALVALDTTRRLSSLSLANVPAEQLGADVGGRLDEAVDLAALLLAAEQLGGAGRVLESAVDYAKTRVQFGRRIGSFQAIKHRCADMLMDVELSRSLVYNALAEVELDRSQLPLQSSLARGYVSEAYVRAAAANLQIHGGIGFTWEHSAHLYLKRAKSSQLLLGRPEAARRRAAELLGIAGAGR